MPLTKALTAFGAGEISPAMWGHVDLSKYQVGCATLRNCFVSVRGGAYSRPGSKFCGQAKQSASASSTAPRIIPFQFQINQSYIVEIGDGYARFIANGAYITETPLSLTAATQANPCTFSVPDNDFSDGDWVAVADAQGMTELNGQTFIVANLAGSEFTITDTFGNPFNTLGFPAYTGGGTVARVYTIAMPYAAIDLPYLKWAQSADVMSLTLVNTPSETEYAPEDLERLAANDWSLVATTFASSIGPPGNVTASPTTTIANLATSDNQPAAQYAYVVTAVDATTGDESIASAVAYTPANNSTGSVDISITAGSVIVNWSPVANAASYNIYRAPEAAWDTGNSGSATPATVPIGSQFGFAGSTSGTQWVDSNVVPDYSTVPPTHQNPFAPGQIVSVGTIPTGGTFNQQTTSAAINSGTGSGAVILPVVVGGNVVAGILVNAGQEYGTNDTVTFTDSSSGASVTAPLVVGPSSGNYPAVVSYFQQRRVYAQSLNNPDTLWASQTGSYTNMDAANPPVDSDAITSNPWAQQVNGIQCLANMPTGLLVGTGLDVWLLEGSGGPYTPVTPSSEDAISQEANGFSPTVPAIKINYQLLFVQALGYIVRALNYNYFTNTYAGEDLTVLANHLFEGYQIVQWGWAREPYKILWAVRNDGILLSLTYLKEQEVVAWARHDTNGEVVSVAVASEPPVDGVYIVVKRFIAGKNAFGYYVERLDNRLWFNAEQCWCVDAGLALPLATPSATLSASSATGSGQLTGVGIPTGGQSYTAPTATLVDPTGAGSGAVIELTVTGGVITGWSIPKPGNNYSSQSTIQVQDATGSGAELFPVISNIATFTASAAVFDGETTGAVGQVIRMGGGKATVTQFVSSTEVLAAITLAITATVPNDPNNMPIPAASGNWSIATPVTSVSGLNHLEGMTVTGLADGQVIPSTVVANGTVALPAAATAVVVGLPFQAQLQSLPMEIAGASSVQGKRKTIPGCTVRLERSRGVKIGVNQVNASQLENYATQPWGQLPFGKMIELKQSQAQLGPGNYLPLFTGDLFAPCDGDWNTPGWSAAPGMVACQQDYPLPMAVLGLFPDVTVGDSHNKADAP